MTWDRVILDVVTIVMVRVIVQGAYCYEGLRKRYGEMVGRALTYWIVDGGTREPFWKTSESLSDSAN